MKKTAAVVFAAVMLLMTAVLPVYATGMAGYAQTDMDYEGEINIRTGAPDVGGENTAVSAASRVSIGDGAIYDTEKDVYCYSVSGAEVEMNVPSGCVTTSPVRITVPEGIETTLFCNGTELPGADLSNIAVQGKYVLRFTSSENFYLSFTVVGAVTGIISGYQMPAGFRVTEAYHEDKSIAASSYVDMSEAGRYTIKYKCDKTGMAYTLDVNIDNEPPTLLLPGVENGVAKGPVDISDLEPGVAVDIHLNGDHIAKEDVLTRSGKYDILLQDEAGNTNSYSFVIRVYFNFSAGLFFAAIILILAALFIYLLLSRKHLRVR